MRKVLLKLECRVLQMHSRLDKEYQTPQPEGKGPPKAVQNFQESKLTFGVGVLVQHRRGHLVDDASVLREVVGRVQVVLHGGLQVREHVLHAARLRLQFSQVRRVVLQLLPQTSVLRLQRLHLLQQVVVRLRHVHLSAKTPDTP